MEQLAIVSGPGSFFFFKTLVLCKSNNHTPVGDHICKNTGQYRLMLKDLKNSNIHILESWKYRMDNGRVVETISELIKCI